VLGAGIVPPLAALLAGVLGAARATVVDALPILLPFAPAGPTEMVGTVPASRVQRAMQSAARGSLADLLAVVVARAVEAHTGQPTRIERIAGEGGLRAIERARSSLRAPHPLLLASEALCVHRAGSDPGVAAALAALQPIAICFELPYLTVAQATLPASAGRCTIGSAGYGGRSSALARDTAARLAASGCREVAFNGGSAALSALLGGQVDAAVLPRALVAAWVDSGALRPWTEPAATPGGGWFGLLAGPGWSPEACAALAAAVAGAVGESSVRAYLKRLGVEPGGDGPLEMGRRIDAERARFAETKKSGMPWARPSEGVNRRGGGGLLL
jgi:tripartite-type tricarboxylate transporter receptor subunit TctC